MPAIYPLYKQAVLAGDSNVDLDTNTITDGAYCALVGSAYVYSAGHQFFSSLSGIVGTPQRITNPTVVSGTFDGDNLVYSAVTGATIVALAIYRRNSGASSTWRLVYFYDTAGGGLPAVPNGQDVTVEWNAAGIFTL